jgi:uncharacterized membrane protein
MGFLIKEYVYHKREREREGETFKLISSKQTIDCSVTVGLRGREYVEMQSCIAAD